MYLCLRHWVLAKDIYFHHHFDVQHQIGSSNSKNSKISAWCNTRYLSAVISDVTCTKQVWCNMFDVTCIIHSRMMFASTKMPKSWLFWMCDVVNLRSLQIQDPDNRASHSTDLAEKPNCNLFRSMIGIILKCWILISSGQLVWNSQMLTSSNNHLLVSEHCFQHRTWSRICRLVHKRSFDSTFWLCLRNLANLCEWCCAMHAPTLFPWFAQCKLYAWLQQAFSIH